MPDRTVNEITDDAYHINGIKSPKAADDARALRFFQNMLSSWSAEGLIVPNFVTENFTLTTGQAIYTIGVSGSPDLDTARPLRIVNAWFRVGTFDYYIDVDMTKTEYSKITSKDLEVRPHRLYYDPQYPNAKIKFDTECDTTHDFYMVSEKALTDVAAVSDTLSLPLEINEALVFNLALRLKDPHSNDLSNDVRKIAHDSKEIVERMNWIEKSEDPVSLSPALQSRGGGHMDFNRGY